ncbi:MAG: oligosaccharide flippase family protein [Agathobacter sp.]|nr:oligosaccharide flippase family protein [Agathobacter sp.]
MFLKSKSKKTAVVLSYCSLILQTLSTMILTRFYLEQLGSDNYGLYQMIYSVAQYILILDLGISTVMTRYISEYRAKGDEKGAENFAFHFAIIVAVVLLFVISIGCVVNQSIEGIYRNLTASEYDVSHRLMNIMIVQLVFTIVSHYFRGLCEAHENFAFTRIITISQIILNFGLSVLFVRIGMGVIGIALANTVVIVLNCVITIIFVFSISKFRIRFHHWEMQFFKPVFLLMAAMLLQAVVGHVNSSADKTILGIMCTKSDVAVYAVAATIITMFNTLPSTISSVFQPSATRMVVNKATPEQLTDFVIRPGRLQFMLTGGFIAGFVVFGQDFVICWAGKDMKDAWLYVLLVLLPNMIPLIQNICLSLLNAMDKRLFRSVILAGMTVVNILISVFLIKRIGPIGAPLGTGISYIIGHCIIMNVYYKKKIGLNVTRMFKEIFKKTWICVLVSFALTLPLMLWKSDGNWLILIMKAIIFCIIYGILLIIYGMNNDEKKMLQSILAKLSFIKK